MRKHLPHRGNGLFEARGVKPIDQGEQDKPDGEHGQFVEIKVGT